MNAQRGQRRALAVWASEVARALGLRIARGLEAGRRFGLGCRRPRLGRLALAAIAAGAACAVASAIAWVVLVRSEPYPVERLARRDAASPIVVDRQGRTLWQAGSATGERRLWTPLVDITPMAVSAALAAEDHRFFEHSGVDPIGVLRALWLNARSLRPAYGASTITMQLVRLVEPELNTRTATGKLIQALHAARLERALAKSEILEQYLNRAYYGNGAFGIGSAAALYFGASAAHLSAAQAAFLAALPRAPSGYDPYRRRPRAERRMRHILERLRELGALSPADHALALDAPLVVRRERTTAVARHFIDHLLLTLPSEELRGARVESTLDLELQRQLEIATHRHLDNVGSRAVTQAGIIVIDNRNGDVLAMVGSNDYEDREGHGAVNVTTLPRRAGSTLKPFVYALALERGDSPATLAYDVVLPGEEQQTYTADVRQHGFARYREALAGSYNLAAVHTLERVGVRTLVERLRLAGVSTLRPDPHSYGLDLAIGDAEIRLSEYAGAFAAFGNQGRAVRPRAVVRVVPAAGTARGPKASEGWSSVAGAAQVTSVSTTRVFDPAVAYQIFDILSDPDARRPMFGRTAPMEVGFPVALKTGTTRGYTDNLAFGTTREFTVGAWAGNFDGTPTEGVMAMQGAAPLVRAAFVSLAALYGTPSAPEPPEELERRDICPISGQLPGPSCPSRKRESFTALAARALDRTPPCSFHARRGEARRGPGLAFPPELAPWASAHGLNDLARNARTPTAGLSIVYPTAGSLFQLDPHRTPSAQIPPLQALPRGGVEFSIDGVPAGSFQPVPGRHVVEARRGRERARSEIVFE
jgi:penicillin-binding protein 1C